MTPLKHATIVCFYGNEKRSDRNDCQVRLGNGQIGVFYECESGEVAYKGTEVSPGHFRLTSKDGGKANLHCLPDGKTFEGGWSEEGWEGMWRITLAE